MPSRLLMLFVLVAMLVAWSTDCRGQVVFNAAFDADTPGFPPNLNPPGPPAGDAISLEDVQGGDSILVQGPAGAFINNSARIFHPQGFGNAPRIVAHVDQTQGIQYNSGFFVVSWRALAESVSALGFASVISPGGAPAFGVVYQQDGTIRFQDASGLVSTGIPYIPGVPQTFTAVVRLGATRSFDLAIDGTTVACGRPLQSAAFTAVARFVFQVQGPTTPGGAAYAIDDIRIEKLPPPGNVPPVLAAIGAKTTTEGVNLQFTVSAKSPVPPGGPDCDGDPLAFTALDLPTGATFDATTREFSWTPDFSQGGTSADPSFYYVTFVVNDGKGGTDFEEVTVTVLDNPNVSDRDGDGIADAGISGPLDNCPDDPNADQADTFGDARGDACDPFYANQVRFDAQPTKPGFLLGESIGLQGTLTVDLTAGCTLLRNVDVQTVVVRLFTSAGVEIPKDQAVDGEPSVVSEALTEACAGTLTTISGVVTPNGVEGSYMSVPIGLYEFSLQYVTLGRRALSVLPDGSCEPTLGEPCPEVLQVNEEAPRSFFVVGDQSGIQITAILKTSVMGLPLDPSTKKSFIQKLDAALARLNRGDVPGACTNFSSFINAVQAGIGKGGLTQEAATRLIAWTQGIKSVIGCAA